jgi:aldehyde:ferredoxin oxidoreductase
VEYPLVPEDVAMDPSSFEGKAERLAERENLMALNDSGVVCKFSRDFMSPERYEMLFDADFEDLLEVGARTVTLERHFNNQCGFDASDDRLPYEDELLGLDDAIQSYYDVRGWNDGTVSERALPA